MIAYAKIIAFVSAENFTVFFFFSKIQQNDNFVIVQKDCEKIQTFCNYFSVCILFWIDLQKITWKAVDLDNWTL